ncbi:MAG TPA: hypothetical protein VM511_05875 [Luteolibacter sp.]|nr:hypothetical protein [Luteolibacter sp.]
MSSDTLSDFPDRLSPMLVKELRQGLRAKTFVIVFLSFQALIALILLSASASGTTGNVGTIISNVIFTFFGIAVLIVQPLRGIGAISSEVKGNTLDMMVLTKLSTARIVRGKWFALVSQSALLLATVIPYLIFRYFLGQMNFVGEIVQLLLMFLVSMTITAVTVSLSASGSVILRVIFPLIGVPVFAWMALFVMFSTPFGGNSIAEMCSLSTDESRLFVSVAILAALYLGWSMLSMGTSMIAPAAENHATFRRIVTFAVAVVACIFMLNSSGFDMDYISVVVAFIGAPAFATALTERSFVAPSVDAAFEKWGVLGKLGGIFLRPGWPSGVFFTTLLILLFGLTASVNWMDVSIRDSQQVQVMSVIGMLLFPAVLVTLLRLEESSRVSAYLLILSASLVFSLVIYAISSALNYDDLLWFFVWNPFTFIFLQEETPEFREAIPHASVLVVFLYTTILIVAAAVTMQSRSQAARITEAS